MEYKHCGVHVFIYLVCENFGILSKVSKSICDTSVELHKSNATFITEVEEVKYTFVNYKSGTNTFNCCTKKEDPNALVVSVFERNNYLCWIFQRNTKSITVYNPNRKKILDTVEMFQVPKKVVYY